jgi:CRISPR/Cas system-associated exonuclease Cas4 (RecB family)
MASNHLTTSSSSSSSTQTKTSSPQTASGTTENANQTGDSIQVGTSENLLEGQSGIKLSNYPLSNVNLNPTSTSSSVVANSLPVTAKHHVNPALLGFAGLFIVAAIVMVFIANRSVKSTT